MTDAKPDPRTLTARKIRGWKNGTPDADVARRALKASKRACAAKRTAAKLDEVLGPVENDEP